MRRYVAGRRADNTPEYSSSSGPCKAPGQAERKQRAESPIPNIGEHLPQTLARMLHTFTEIALQRTSMHYTNYQPTPVYSSDRQPLMPCHPARARKLLRIGRAAPYHIKGIFGIRLLGRTRADSSVQDVSINIDPGSQTSGIAIVTDDEDGQRTVLGAYEIKHRAFTFKATMTRRRSYRRTRRYRLRYRKQRFDNRRRKPGALPPSVDSLRIDTLRIVRTPQQIYPIGGVSIERNKFDTQLMNNPDIKDVEYQRGTLFGTQVRAYIFDRDRSRCIYCGKSRTRLELDHVRPRAVGSDRVDNLVVSCRDCNVAKDNQPIEIFLASDPVRRQRILERVAKSQASAAHVNAALPAIIRDLWALGVRLSSTDAATVAWNRQHLNVRKTHCYDAALQGSNFSTVTSLPAQILQLRSANGRSKQKANIDRHGTPVGKPFRNQQRMPRHRRAHAPAAGHSDRAQRHGPALIQTGDTIKLMRNGAAHIGRAVCKSQGARFALHGAKPSISAETHLCTLLARNPGHSIRWSPPSQQGHANNTDQIENAQQTTSI